MAAIGPLGGWTLSRAVALAKQGSITNNWPQVWVQFLAIAACLANNVALERAHTLSMPIVPIPKAGAKL